MNRSLLRSAGVIGIATMTSRVLGLVRDQVFAFLFGAGDAMDAFRIAFRLPNMLRDLFAEGAMSAALVPTFTRAIASGGKPAVWRTGSNLISVLLIVTGVLALAGMLFAEPLVTLYAGDFRAVPGKFELTVRLTRIMFPFLTLVTIAAALMGMLNALHRFFIPALSPAMFNVGAILCALTLVPLASRVGVAPILAIGIGTLVGGVGQVVLQWPALTKEGFRYRPAVDLRDRWLREIGRLMLPGVAGLASVQINLFVNSWLATSLGTGAVSWLDYAFRLMYMPIGLFGLSIATASMPDISGHAAADNDAGVRESVSNALRMMLMLNVPATAGLLVLATPIVRLIFEHGRFTATDTTATAAALVYYSPGLVGYSAVKLISPAFYALGSGRIPLIASAVSVAVNVACCVLLVGVLGHRGLALGTALSALTNAGILLWLLRSRLAGLDGARVLVTLTKISIASLAMGYAAYATEGLLHVPFPGASVATQSIRVFAAIGAGIAVLATSAHLLRIEEFSQNVRLLKPW
ncbi:MAG: murein biosynthesis integral membrane protein MurJ [Vicinamibacterales bacterium]|nr:murein biosynthesis integral membrane protein MurJ [Vicinamibacterales bacterium]